MSFNFEDVLAEIKPHFPCMTEIALDPNRGVASADFANHAGFVATTFAQEYFRCECDSHIDTTDEDAFREALCKAADTNVEAAQDINAFLVATAPVGTEAAVGGFISDFLLKQAMLRIIALIGEKFPWIADLLDNINLDNI